MAEIIPFKGILYNAKAVGGIKDVVAPPYDVISPEMQVSLYERHPKNVIRLILGKEFPGDGPNDKYRRAGELFRQWLRDGTLIGDPTPGLYIYEEEYERDDPLDKAAGSAQDTAYTGPREVCCHPHKPCITPDRRRRIQRGIIAAVKIEEYEKGVILPHEDTMPGPKQDRLALMRECKANLSPIFGMYPDPGGETDAILDEITSSNKPRIQLTDDAGISHRVWSTTDEYLISKLKSSFAATPIFIADGHHRYETTLVYRNEIRSQMGNPPYALPVDYAMMWLVNMDTQDMTVLPTHRVVGGLKSFEPARFISAAEELFKVTRVDRTLTEIPGILAGYKPATHAFAAYLGGEAGFFILTLRNDRETRARLDQILGDEAGTARGRLDVTVLHRALISHALGKIEGKTLLDIKYTRDIHEASHLVESGRYQLAFFLSPTGLDEIRAVVKAGSKMPQKSTYFYPKPLSGLLFRDLQG
ncbi:MAG TPA: DUF1015 domain-containing protein [Firmicutes bacterium]|nr:DUF1015 domain-containing protein [Bacillota bacterium]